MLFLASILLAALTWLHTSSRLVDQRIYKFQYLPAGSWIILYYTILLASTVLYNCIYMPFHQKRKSIVSACMLCFLPPEPLALLREGRERMIRWVLCPVIGPTRLTRLPGNDKHVQYKIINTLQLANNPTHSSSAPVVCWSLDYTHSSCVVVLPAEDSTLAWDAN